VIFAIFTKVCRVFCHFLPSFSTVPTHSGDIGDEGLKWYKTDQNLTCFGPRFFGGAPLEFLDLHYKIQPASHHVMKFHGDRPREFGVEKKEKHLRQNKPWFRVA